MNSRIDHIYKSLISVTIILMFTAALVAARARANLPGNDSTTDGFAAGNAITATLDTESLRKFESLPVVFDTILELPIDIQLGIDEGSRRTGTHEEPGRVDSTGQ